jgi:hypothetical protein
MKKYQNKINQYNTCISTIKKVLEYEYCQKALKITIDKNLHDIETCISSSAILFNLNEEKNLKALEKTGLITSAMSILYKYPKNGFIIKYLFPFLTFAFKNDKELKLKEEFNKSNGATTLLIISEIFIESYELATLCHSTFIESVKNNEKALKDISGKIINYTMHYIKLNSKDDKNCVEMLEVFYHFVDFSSFEMIENNEKCINDKTRSDIIHFILLKIEDFNNDSKKLYVCLKILYSIQSKFSHKYDSTELKLIYTNVENLFKKDNNLCDDFIIYTFKLSGNLIF